MKLRVLQIDIGVFLAKIFEGWAGGGNLQDVAFNQWL